MLTPEPLDAPVETPPPDLANHPYAILKRPVLARVLCAQLLSTMAMQALMVAIGWELYERTHSALALGLVGLTQILPLIALLLPAGHLADHANRIKLIQRGRGVAAIAGVILMGISWWHASVTWMYVTLLIIGAARAFVWPAATSLVPLLVPRSQLMHAITWNSSVFHFASIIGPMIGGWALAATHRAAFVYAGYAILMFASFILLSGIHVEQKRARSSKFSWGRLALGWRYVWRRETLLSMMTLDLFAALFGGASALLPIYAKDILHCGPQGLGLLQSAIPIGSVTCALILAHRAPIRRLGRTLLTAVAVFGAAIILFGISKWFWFSMAMLLVCGAADNLSVVIRQSVIQGQTPDRMRGRVASVQALFVGTSNELGAFESGLVASWLGAVASVTLGGFITLGVVWAAARHWPLLKSFTLENKR